MEYAFRQDNYKESVLVSIIIPSYNASKFIRETITSVRQQSYQNWEMIVVDDYSSDDTCKIIEQECGEDFRIKLIKLDMNKGPAHARNVGIKNARGKYLAFIDADDTWLPEKLQKQVSFMQSKDIAFSFTEYRQISEDGKWCGKIVSVPVSVTYNELLKETIIGGHTVMLDIEKIGFFEYSGEYHEDYITWLNLLKRCKVAYGLQEDLARYRQVNKSRSRNKLKSAYRMWRVFRDTLKLPKMQAIWCLISYSAKALIKNWQAYPRRN